MQKAILLSPAHFVITQIKHSSPLTNVIISSTDLPQEFHRPSAATDDITKRQYQDTYPVVKAHFFYTHARKLIS